MNSPMNYKLNKHKYPGAKRLMLEALELKDNTEDYCAQPIDDNLFEWHFTVRGPPETAFEGGYYHGRLSFPTEYPMKPPSIILLTPNGRFEINKKICLSISGFHPETWQPSWSVRTALLALIGFMPTKANGAIGSLNFTDAERRMLAMKSRNWSCEHCGLIRNLLKQPGQEHRIGPSMNPHNHDDRKVELKDSKHANDILIGRLNDSCSPITNTVEHETSQESVDNVQSATTTVESINSDRGSRNNSVMFLRSIFVILIILIIRRVILFVQP